MSARGTTNLTVTASEIQSSAALVAETITVRESRLVAGLTKDCDKWVKKHTKARAKCSDKLLIKGSAEAAKCKDGGVEPAGCDPGQHVEAVLALAYGGADQQTDPMNAQLVDRTVLKEQLKCQKRFGKAGVNYFLQRTKFALKKCIQADTDSEACRAARNVDARKKLAQIDKCLVVQGTDIDSSITLPDVGAGCAGCISGGVIDRKCLKDCLEVALGDLSDGLVGEVGECGNGIVQPGEECDDGNTADGDCCSATCLAEAAGSQTCGQGICEATTAACDGGAPATCTPGPAGTEGPSGQASCNDGLDNDCDGTTDLSDTDCN